MQQESIIGPDFIDVLSDLLGYRVKPAASVKFDGENGEQLWCTSTKMDLKYDIEAAQDNAATSGVTTDDRNKVMVALAAEITASGKRLEYLNTVVTEISINRDTFAPEMVFVIRGVFSEIA